MLLDEIRPSAHLSEFIRLYRIVDFKFACSATLPSKAYPPRPEHCLQFYPRDTEMVVYGNKDREIKDKRSTLIGQHTVVNTRHVGRDFLSVQVVFKPGALFRLTGIPSSKLSDVYMDAQEALGKETSLVNEALFHSRSYPEMIAVVEAYLTKLFKKTRKDLHPVDLIGVQMMEDEDSSLDYYIKLVNLSHRQFDRKFQERVGIAPKQFLQVIRFDRAFRMKNRFPHKDWLTIAIHCGYYDYQHLVRDYKIFTGCTPNEFVEIEMKAPERAFGQVEV